MEQLFEAHKRDRAKLNELLRELRHRASPMAQAMQKRVEAALRRLPPPPPPPASAFDGPRSDWRQEARWEPPPQSARPSAAAGSAGRAGFSAHATASANAMPRMFLIHCRQCQVELRITVRAPSAVYGCPRCQTEFDASWRDGAFQIEWRASPPPASADQRPMTHAQACEILGVDPDASPEEIKLAWRRACQHYHPDRHMQLPERLQHAAKDEIQRINAAYALLSVAVTETGVAAGE